MADRFEEPSRDPTNDDSLVGMARQILDKFLQGVDDMLPATVVAYDRVTNRAQIQPMIMMLTTGNSTVARAQVASIPVLQYGGGGFFLGFNLKPGDFGWVKANDRDTSLFLQSGAADKPNTLRKHSFEDALFIPDILRGFTINPEDMENAVLQSKDGTVRIALWPDKIKLSVGEESLTFETDKITSTVEIFAPKITIDGVDFATHTHGEVQTGTDNTGIVNT